jgi:hypothetical protein
MSHKPPKEQLKKPAMTLKEKRAMKREKKQQQSEQQPDVPPVRE